ncbi:MAG: DNA-processing protein DprA [Candidatus Marinimicrobia bacterium]|nr:DNA-processing protein DprA [Candidatus Neomarinimicrobiota bacterium]
MYTLGNKDLLKTNPIALFCSVKCPGELILNTYDLCLKWREEGKTVISGFHSPMEKECLRILLKGSQPIVICLARGIWKRFPPELKKAVNHNRLLIITKFPSGINRATKRRAIERNRFIAHLSDTLFISYASPGGKLESLCKEWMTLNKSLYTFKSKYNGNLLQFGVKPYCN